MKKGAIIRIICWAIVALTLAGILIAGLTGHFFSFGDFPFSIHSGYHYKNAEDYSVGSGSVPVDDIDSLEIHWIAGSVDLVPSSDKNITFTESTGLDLEDQLRYLVQGNTLIIQFAESDNYFDDKKSLEITVPKALAGELRNLNFDCVSADINLCDMNAQDILLDTVSGTATAERITCKKLGLDTVSGELRATDTSADNLKLDAVSGSADVSGTFREIDSDTVSGDIRIASKECPKSIETDAVSGDLTLILPEDSDFTADLDSVSGEIECDFASKTKGSKTICGNGDNSFDLESVSGDVHIQTP